MRPLVPLLFLLGCTDPGLDPVDTDADLDPAPIRSCRVQIQGELPDGVQQGAVAGTFSDWQPVALDDADGDGTGTADLGTLVPGTYAYKFVWDGTYEDQPPPWVPTTWDDGVENRALIVEDCRQPDLQPVSISATPQGTLHAEVQWVRGRDGDPLDRESIRISLGDAPVPPTYRDGLLVIDAAGLPPGKHSLRVQASDTAGRSAEPVWLPVWVEDEPFAWSDGVLYFAFVDRFRDGGPSPEDPITGHLPGAGYREGDLVGLRDALREGFFDDFGVRSIWLSPVADNPDGAWAGSVPGQDYTGYHGYWPVAPGTVEGRFGTTQVDAETALHQVVEEAHARGIRVVLDLVLNHVHQDHPWVSEHPDWFDLDAPCVCGDPGCGWEEKPRTCRFAPYLPDVEYRARGAVEGQLDEVWWWLTTFDLDGLRVDAAKHMDHVILRRLSLMLQDRVDAAGGAHVYLVGETFTGPDQRDLIRAYVAEHELDGQFDFPLYWRIRESLRDEGSFRPLAAEARAGAEVYGPFLPTMSPFFGNHDVARLSTELAGCEDWSAVWGVCSDVLGKGPADRIEPDQAWLVDRMSLAWALVVTRPGVPLLYYGDELGLAGANDPDNRRDRPWTELSAAQRELQARFEALAAARAGSVALRRGQVRELWVDDDLYVIARVHEQQVALAWTSRWSDGPRSIPVPPDVLPSGATVVDLLGGDVSLTLQDGRITLPTRPWSYGVLAD